MQDGPQEGIFCRPLFAGVICLQMSIEQLEHPKRMLPRAEKAPHKFPKKVLRSQTEKEATQVLSSMSALCSLFEEIYQTTLPKKPFQSTRIF